ncbi:hypothetical protein [Streptomyces malaysiensis]|uniref:hypothetical protein n=1 Tax=Streptomyces malaysiensis TaxID=92644 RepID=UPI0036934B82
MKLTELIADAEKVLKEHGDIPVIAPDTGCGCCRTSIYDPAGAEVVTEVEAYDDSWKNITKLPSAYVVS